MCEQIAEVHTAPTLQGMPPLTAFRRVPRLPVGVNYPWFAYGTDFGIGPWGRRQPWSDAVDGDLREFQDLGLDVVRWWLLGDGICYGSGEHEPRLDTHPSQRWFSEAQWRFIPPDRGPQVTAILDDFEALLQRFQRASAQRPDRPLKLLPTILTPAICFPGNWYISPLNPNRSNGQPPPAGFVKNGRADLVVDSRKSLVFFETLLDPLLARAARYRDHIYAVDVMNEPEWCTHIDGTELLPAQTVPFGRMRQFLAECIEHVHHHDLLATIGFAHFDSLTRWGPRQLGADILQFHHYGMHPLPRNRFLGECIVGELATAPQGISTTPPVEQLDHTWPELGGIRGDQGVLPRLCRIQNRGFSRALLWSRRAVDSATRWDGTTRSDIRDFRAGRCRSPSSSSGGEAFPPR